MVGLGEVDRSRELPFEPEGRPWLARALPDILRRTGIAAPARVARILAKSGNGSARNAGSLGL